MGETEETEMRRPKLGSVYRPKYRNASGALVESEKYWIKFYVNGIPVREPTHSGDYKAAEDLLKLRNAGIAATGESTATASPALSDAVAAAPAAAGSMRPTIEPVTIGRLLQDLKDNYRLQEKKSVNKCVCRIDKHLLPFFGRLLASDLETKHITAYKLRRKETTRQPKLKKSDKREVEPMIKRTANATINRELELLQRAYRLAWKAEPPLVSKVPWIEMLPEDNTRTGTLAHDGYLRLLRVLPPPYGLLLVIGYHTGGRLGELLAIRWAQVDLRRHEIRLEASTTKTKKARILPVYGDMEAWLAMACQERGSKYPQRPWVFQAEGQQLQFDWRIWKRCCAAAEVPGLLFHDLRRTALTNMIDAGISEKEAMEISGHTTRKTFERYHIVSDRHVRKVADRMTQFLKAKTAEITAEFSTAAGKVTGKVMSVNDGKLLN